jgi:hypothetical protein
LKAETYNQTAIIDTRAQAHDASLIHDY